MSDPVAAKSSFLCLYMSNHPDTLVSYVKHFGEVSDSTITNAKMTSIDTKGMTLSYQSKSGTSEVRIGFDPPLCGYEEVKPRLIAMKVDAEESLGMTAAPQITRFYMSKDWISVFAIYLVLIYLTVAPPPSADLPPYWRLVSRFRSFVGGDWAMKLVWISGGVIHSLESLYTLVLVRRHRTGFILGTVYVISTVIFGYAVWTGIRRRVHAARIESIMKAK